MRMIKIGNILFVILLLAQGAFASQVTTSLTEDKIEVGESVVLKISIKGAGFSSIDPHTAPNVPGLIISYNGSSQHMTFINGAFSRGSSLNYRIDPQRPGVYTIPPITFSINGKKMQSQQVTLTVTRGATRKNAFQNRGYNSDERGDKYISQVEMPREKAFVGEPVLLRYYLLSTVENFKIVYMMQVPEVKGFLFRELKEEKSDVVVTHEDREFLKKYVATFVLIPSGAGKYSIGGGVFRVRFQSFPFGREIDVNFGTRDIIVQDYPAGGKPDGFKANTGNFSLKVDYSPEPVELYREKKITVTVEGTGNLLTLTRPVLENSSEMKILPEDGKEEIRLENDQVKGSKQFFFTCVPEKPGTIKLGAINLAFFDPASQAYKTVRSSEIQFTVTGTVREKNKSAFDSDKEKKFDFNIVYVLAVVFIFGMGITALVLWERKRYHVLTNGNIEKKAPEPEPLQQADASDHLKEMKVAIDVGDSDVFLSSAHKLVSLLLKQKSGSDAAQLEAVRNAIYNFRYGGGKVSKDEMQRIFTEIKNLT